MTTKLARYFLFCLSVLFAETALAEKYHTWVDDEGNVRFSPVSEEKNPLIQSDAPSEETSAPMEQPVLDESAPVELVKQKQSEPAVESVGESVSEARFGQNVVREVPKRDTARSNAATDLTVVNPEDFVDGDELVRQGYRRPEEDIAHYTWVDADGNLQTTVYRRSGEKKILLNPPSLHEAAPTVSAYTEVTLKDALLPTVNEDALKVMGVTSTESVLAKFSERCCKVLETDFVSELEFDEPQFLEVDKESPTHIFDTGKSPYDIIQLPVAVKPYYLRLKTFERDGVMIPTLVFLDGDFTPTRLIYNASSEYYPENWVRYAFLESSFLITPQTGEKYLMVLTQRKDLNASTSIESSKGLLTLEHRQYGSFEVLLTSVK